jgi:two-component system sensor kinase
MNKFNFSEEVSVRILTGFLIFLFLYIINQYSVILFQTISEIFAVVICLGIFFVTWNSRVFIKNNFFVFLGISLFFIGVVHIVHIILYSSMPMPVVLKTANIHQQVKLVSEYFLALSLILSFYFINKKIKTYIVIPIWAGIIFIIFFLIYKGIFPANWKNNLGLTDFNELSDYIISGLLIISIMLLYKKKNIFDKEIFKFLLISIILFIITIPIFSIQKDIPEIFIFLASTITILAFYLLYKGIIETTLTKPYTMLFKELKDNHDKLNDLNKQLQQNIRDLEIINKDLEDFNWSISHDLKTPFNIIGIATKNIIEDSKNLISEKSLKYLEIVKEESKKGQKLIEELLHFFRSSMKKLEVQDISIEIIARDIFEEIRLSCPDRNIILNIKSIPKARGDIVSVKEVLYNLILNAIKFTKNKETAIIEIGGWEKENEKCFYVKDNGIGFNIIYANKIFNILEKAHNKKEYDGDGIGLAIVNKIIKRHAGKVWAESKENEGAIFYFTLPV